MKRALLLIASLALVPFAASAGPIVYVAHGGGNVGAPFGGEIGTIDLDTGAYSSLGTYGSLTSLVWSGSSLYTYETQSASILEVDPVTGSVLSSVALASAPLTDMAYDPTTGQFYGTDVNFDLVQVDILTGTTSLIAAAAPDSGGGFRQIAFAADGTLYMHATNVPGEFFTIDPMTGAILTTITGGAPGGALGLAVDPATGLLIASECCGSPDGSLGERLFWIDAATGSATLLFDFDDERRMQDFAFVDVEVPEPGTLALLGLGLAGIGLARRRRNNA